MSARLSSRFKFALERFVLGGPLNLLVVIAVLLGAFTAVGGTLVWMFGEDQPPADRDSWIRALWWAFLRLSDPGYLGDDTGTFVRVVSTALTVLGYVVFLGSLVAVMTQWLNARLSGLQRGLTPLALNNHILVLGWSSRTVAVVREIMLSEARVERFLRRSGTGKLRVVVLAEDVGPAMIHELKERLGPLWNPRQIILRNGSPLRLEHLRRADFLHAAAIVLPAPDSSTDVVQYPDATTIKTILAIGRASKESGDGSTPLMVAEVSDASKLNIAEKAYGGPIEVVASDLFVGRLMAQNIRHPGISEVYAEMLRHGRGCEVYLRGFPELAGRRVRQISPLFPNAVALGLLRGEGRACDVLLNPGAEVALQPGDRIVFLASSFDDCAASNAADDASTELQTSHPQPPQGPQQPRKRRRVLVLGWNHTVPALVRELESYENERFDVDVISLVPSAERKEELARLEVKPSRVAVRLIEGEYTSLAELNKADAGSYDNAVVLGSHRLESHGERDARSILGSLVLHEALADAKARPQILVEVLDEDNVPLVADAGDECVLSPAIMSHILTQVALHRDLRAVYDGLFGPEGAEIFFRPASQYGICERPVTFADVQAAAMASSEIALGLRLHTGPGNHARIHLNPDRTQRWQLGEGDEVVVLSDG